MTTDISLDYSPEVIQYMFKLEKQVESAAYNIRWWFELPDEEAYKRVPKSSINFSRTYNQRLEVYPGWLGVAVALTTDEVRNDPYFRDHIRMYLDGYHKGWDFFQEFSKKFSRFGLQPIQDRRQALFERFVKCRAKYKGSIFFQASLLTKMGYWAGFMFALAQELIEMDAIIPISQRAPVIEPNPGLAGFITREQEKILQFIKAELAPCKRPQGKLIAEIIIVLRDSGYFVQTQGKLTKIHKAFCDMFPGKVAELSGINDYINSRDNHNYVGPKKITKDELNQLQQKLKNFVE